VLLKLFQARGRFPRRPEDVTAAAVEAIAGQVGVAAVAWQDYDWRGRNGGEARQGRADHRPQARGWQARAAVQARRRQPVQAGRRRLALGWCAYFGDRSQLPHNLRAIELLWPDGAPHLLGQALSHAGQSSSRCRDVAEAKRYLGEAHVILRPQGRTKFLAGVLLYMATSCKHAGDVVAARAFAEEAWSLAEALGDVWSHDACEAQLASIAFEGGKMAEAITRAAEAVETCRRHGNLRSQFVALQWLAGFLLVDDQFEAGNTKAQEAFELARALGNLNFPDSIDQFALIAASCSDPDRAARLAGYADAYAERHGISQWSKPKSSATAAPVWSGAIICLPCRSTPSCLPTPCGATGMSRVCCRRTRKGVHDELLDRVDKLRER